jgi:hypothetical protein
VHPPAGQVAIQMSHSSIKSRSSSAPADLAPAEKLEPWARVCRRSLGACTWRRETRRRGKGSGSKAWREQADDGVGQGRRGTRRQSGGAGARRTKTTRQRVVTVGDDREYAVCREYVKDFFAILPPNHLNRDGGSSDSLCHLQQSSA